MKEKLFKFGERLRALRTHDEMTLKAFAEILGVKYTTLRDWEIRGNQPSYEMLIKIADYFKVSIDYLLGREDI